MPDSQQAVTDIKLTHLGSAQNGLVKDIKLTAELEIRASKEIKLRIPFQDMEFAAKGVSKK